MSEAARHDDSTWRSRAKFTFLAFASVGGFFLLAEHRAHVLPWLPWLFLAACPLMHCSCTTDTGDMITLATPVRRGKVPVLIRHPILPRMQVSPMVCPNQHGGDHE